MNRRTFFTVVPKPMQIWAIIAVVCTVVAGFTVAVLNSDAHELPRHIALYSAGGLLGGIFIATWLLCVGYVYADARDRAMRPVLWSLVVILFPHLLGFLLYFVMRQPLASYCAHCGLTVAQGQRFCSWCGTLQTSSASFPPAVHQAHNAGA